MGDTFEKLIKDEGFVPKNPGRSAVDDKARRADAAKARAGAEARLRERQSQDFGVTSDPLVRWRSHGVSEKKFRALCRGGLPLHDKLDLHGEVRETVCGKVDEFIASAMLKKHEAVEIVCGRGLHTKGEAPVLKTAVSEHMRGHRSVRAYTLAPKNDGAYYVLLKVRGHGHS